MPLPMRGRGNRTRGWSRERVRGRRRRGLGRCWKNVGRVWSGPNEVFLDHLFKIPQRYRIHIQLPLQVLAHLPLHLVDLAQLKHTLRDDTPRLIRVSVVADDLGREHERRDE